MIDQLVVVPAVILAILSKIQFVFKLFKFTLKTTRLIPENYVFTIGFSIIVNTDTLIFVAI